MYFYTEDLTGKRFGKWTVLKSTGTKNKKKYYLCRCDCGTEREVIGTSLRNGMSQSCGCTRRETYYKNNHRHINCSTHGMSGTRIYNLWAGIKARCYNPKNENYKNYGARGITMCYEWKSHFESFYEWAIANGYEEGLSIDRINVNGNYEPSNCRWINLKMQSVNKRSNRYITYKGETKCLSEWAEILGLTPTGLSNRLKNKSVEEAFNISSFYNNEKCFNDTISNSVSIIVEEIIKIIKAIR